MTYTIWDLIWDVRTKVAIDHEDVAALAQRIRERERGRRSHPLQDLYRTLAKRTGEDFFICDGAQVPMPGYTEVSLLEHGGAERGYFFCQSYAESGQQELVLAYCRGNEQGYALRRYCTWIESEDRWVTDHRLHLEYDRCESCEGYFHVTNLVYRETQEAYYCDVCAYTHPVELEDDDDDEIIRPYGTDVLDCLGWAWEYKDSTERLFGIELEMEFPDDSRSVWAGYALDITQGLDDLAIWKHDGSLDHGAELVTLPLPLREWQDKGNPVYRLLRDRAFRDVARSHNTTTCGLHVHVTRRTIPEPVVAKLVYLFNDPSMEHLTLMIARRPQSHPFCQVRKKKWTSKSGKRQWNQDGRYTPVNLTDNTVEFRLFKGTLRIGTIRASVEFCQAAIDYCNNQGAVRLSGPDFQAWLVAQPRKAYPALREYLIYRGLLPYRKHRTARRPSPCPKLRSPIPNT